MISLITAVGLCWLAAAPLLTRRRRAAPAGVGAQPAAAAAAAPAPLLRRPTPLHDAIFAAAGLTRVNLSLREWFRDGTAVQLARLKEAVARATTA